MNSKPDQIVPDNARDQVFKELKSINKNNICLDCEKKNTKWASIHLGIHLCIDCAGKHRQYGVVYSFVKSTNLDSWNRKQLLFMQKGGNSRALDYFKKCGIISENQKHIDYKSPIVQKYKSILTAQVQSQLSGVTIKVKETVEKKKVQVAEEDFQGINKPSQIPQAQIVQKQQKGKKKNKKKAGKKINLEDFQTMEFDDGVPIEEKQKIIRAYESTTKTIQQGNIAQNATILSQNEGSISNQLAQEKARELTQQQSKQKLQQMKTKVNVKNISSEDFKDNSLDDRTVRQNLNKFQGQTAISSSAFFGEEDKSQEEGSVAKIKDYVTDKGGQIYSKLSGFAASYWKKG